MLSLAHSVPKPLKVPSFARSVTKPLKVPSLARSVPKPLLTEPRGRPPPPDVKERSDWLRDRCLVTVVFLKRNFFQINLL